VRKAINQHEWRTELNPNAWFTSLWTLQEVCLRPDMLLLNQKFEFLSLTPDRAAISLSDIVHLVTATTDVEDLAISWGQKTPLCVRRLMAFVYSIGFVGLLRLSRMQILTMGNHRHCKD